MGRLAFTSLAAAGLASSVAGCGGGGSSPAVANLATTTSNRGRPATTSSRASTDAALARCFSSRGLSASVGAAGASSNEDVLDIGGVVIPGANPSSPQFQSAMSACRKYMPGGGPPQLTPAQQAERAKGLAALARCMRHHGVANFPEPNGQGNFPPGSIEQLDPQSAVFQAAYKACWSLFPKVGPQMRIGP